MKSLITTLTALLNDLGSLCSVDPSRDLICIKRRAEHEGLSFLTITLPDFATDFERCLELGHVDSTLFAGWRKRGCLPAFLQGFTSLVFNKHGGIEDASTNAIFSVRQICRIFKKVRVPCSSARDARAFLRYRDIESVLPRDCGSFDTQRLSHFCECADIIWNHVLGFEEFNSFELLPRHGPGATAEHINGNRKYSHRAWNHRLESMFPMIEFNMTSINQVHDDKDGIDKYQYRSYDEELPVRVITVPKTLKTPRIIAIEPVCMQYTQQAVAHWLMRKIETSDLTRGSIRFTDQSVNRELAMVSSRNKSLATIDLSDASDRVPMVLVERMLRSQPSLLDAIKACRSEKAKLPDGEIIHLKKFASMGSALCFPVESMYFFTILVHASLWKQGLLPSRRRILECARRIHVYGDDILIPVRETDSAIEALTTFGCKVNTDKSFWKGSFRESCGLDAFNGVDVTPVYVREMCPQSKRSTQAVLSWCATSNLLHKAGLWQTSNAMKVAVEKVLGKLPVTTEKTAGLGWHSFCGVPKSKRSCRYLHVPLVHTYKVRTISTKDSLDGYPALLKFFLKAERRSPASDIQSVDKNHLAFSARCGTVSRKRHWVPLS